MKIQKKNISRRKAMGLIGVTLAAPAFIGRANAAEVTLRLHHFLPAVSNMHRLLFVPWAKELSDKSGGRLKMEIFPGMQLGGKPGQLADQARKGIADITWTLPVYSPGRFPVAETMTLPFMVTSAEETSVAMHRLMDEFGTKEYPGVHSLAFHVHAGGKFHMRGGPVTSAADLKGLRVRAPNQSFGKLLSALGAEPVFFPVTEMAVGLANGVIDGTCLPYEVVPAFKLHELTKSHSAPAPGARGLYANSFALLMNQKRYEGLPDDLRAVLDKSSGMALSQRIGKAFDGFEKLGIKIIKKRGNKVAQIPADEVNKWRQASGPVYEHWTKTLNDAGHDGGAVLAKLNQLLDKPS